MKRKQIWRSYATGREARDELAKICGELVKGTYVRPTSASGVAVVTRGASCPAGRQATTMAGNRDYTKPVIDALGDLPVQELTKAHIDQLLSQFESGTAPGKKRHAFGVRARRYVFATLCTVLEKPARKSSWPWLNISAAPLAAEGW